MSDTASMSMTSRVIAMIVAVILVGVILTPIVNSIANGGDSGGSGGEPVGPVFNEGAVGADMGYYTSSPVSGLSVTFECNSENITLSGDYSATYPTSDMILMVADNQSLVVKDGTMYYYDGFCTEPLGTYLDASITITLDSNGLNDKPYQWVYFPTVDGEYGCYTNGYDHAISDAVSVASYSGFSVIIKNGVVVDSLVNINANPIVADGKTIGYEIVGNKTPNYEVIWDTRDNEGVIEKVPFVDGQWMFHIEDGGAVINKCNIPKNTTSIVIPDTVSANGVSYPVTQIKCAEGYQQVINNYYLADNATLTFPNSVILIGSEVFQNCDKLTIMNLPASVVTIEDRAFDGCHFNAGITVPNSASISPDSGMQIADFNITSQTQGDWSFSLYNNGVIIHKYNGTVGDSLVIPDSFTVNGTSYPVTQIGNQFEPILSSDNPFSISIPDTVTKINSNAFKNCHFAGILDLPDSLIFIGGGAFEYAEILTELNIPDSVTYIGARAFMGAGGTETIDGDGYSFTRICHVHFPESLEYLGYGAFEYNQMGGPLNLPESLVYIGDYALYEGGIGTEEYYNEKTGNVDTIYYDFAIPMSVGYVGSGSLDRMSGLMRGITNASASYWDGYNIGDGYFSYGLNLGVTIPEDIVSIWNEDSLSTAGIIQMKSNEGIDSGGDSSGGDSSGGDSSGSNNGMTNTILRLIPLFAMLGVLIGFAVPLVSNRFE